MRNMLGFPLSRAPLGHNSGVCRDDKLFLQLFPMHVPADRVDLSPPGRDLEACSLADKAYKAVGLEAHPKKARGRAADFKAWGAHFEGNAAYVGMDRSKLVSLCAHTGGGTERLQHKILALWAFAFQFRRPLFAHCFKKCIRQVILSLHHARAGVHCRDAGHD